MDETEQLVSTAEYSVAVMGRAGQFLLVDLAGPIDEAREVAAQLGYRFCGTLAVRGGVPSAAVQPQDPDALYTLLLASLRFARTMSSTSANPSPAILCSG